ncbi:MAG: peptidyl-prolyl cis-trans isomerase A (cyclophilin A) [Crocinitomix sp.]|jgi:peptidyl-prolyl cis-trans isomerase A (cyclophilin A)
MKLLSLAITFLMTVGLFAQSTLSDGMYAKITVEKGEFLCQLEFEKAPLTVASFVGLAEGNFKVDTLVFDKPFFDGLTFHRVVPNFVIQGGDPLGNGMGDPGYKFRDEFDTTLLHTEPGILSMANSGKDLNGSQFFVTHKATPWLDGRHAVFGHVIEGMDVVNAIVANDKIITVEIIRVGKAAEKFNATKVFSKKRVLKSKAKKKALKVRNKAFKKSMKKDHKKAKQTKVSGLMYQIIEKGDGVKPLKGEKVTVHYTGYFMNGEKFDSSVDRNKPFEFPVGAGRVIKGWDEGIPLCDIGGKIKLIIPYWLAYGKAGRSTIPPKSTLIFDVEVISSTQDK